METAKLGKALEELLEELRAPTATEPAQIAQGPPVQFTVPVPIKITFGPATQAAGTEYRHRRLSKGIVALGIAALIGAGAFIYYASGLGKQATSNLLTKNSGNIEYLGSEMWGKDSGYETLGPGTPGSWEGRYIPDEYRIGNTNGLGACLRTEPNETSKTRRCWREGTRVLVPGEEENGYLPIIEPAEGWMPKQYLVQVNE